MNLSPDERDRVLDELFAGIIYEDKQPDEYTMTELMEKYGISKWLIEKRIKQLLDVGKLTKRETMSWTQKKCAIWQCRIRGRQPIIFRC